MVLDGIDTLRRREAYAYLARLVLLSGDVGRHDRLYHHLSSMLVCVASNDYALNILDLSVEKEFSSHANATAPNMDFDLIVKNGLIVRAP